MKIYKITHWVRRTGPDKLGELMDKSRVFGNRWRCGERDKYRE